jgi:hypothetical protein
MLPRRRALALLDEAHACSVTRPQPAGLQRPRGSAGLDAGARPVQPVPGQARQRCGRGRATGLGGAGLERRQPQDHQPDAGARGPAGRALRDDQQRGRRQPQLPGDLRLRRPDANAGGRLQAGRAHADPGAQFHPDLRAAAHAGGHPRLPRRDVRRRPERGRHDLAVAAGRCDRQSAVRRATRRPAGRDVAHAGGRQLQPVRDALPAAGDRPQRGARPLDPHDVRHGHQPARQRASQCRGGERWPTAMPMGRWPVSRCCVSSPGSQRRWRPRGAVRPTATRIPSRDGAIRDKALDERVPGTGVGAGRGAAKTPRRAGPRLAGRAAAVYLLP